MLHVPLSTCLESKDNILHMSLEIWLEATQATSAARPTTKTIPCKPNIESFCNPKNFNIKQVLLVGCTL